MDIVSNIIKLLFGSKADKDRKQIENLIYRGKKAVKAILEKEGFDFEDQR